jgi:hypothetical protein
MTQIQAESFLKLIRHFSALSNIEFHHGDCIGSDDEAHTMVRTLPRMLHLIHLHPPIDNSYRAHCTGDLSEDPLPYIDRNHVIVHMTDFMIATPEGDEVLRSGTWATIRYAYKAGKNVYLIDSKGQIYLKFPSP